MKEIQKALPVVLVILIFLFWFLLGKGNYFHWDEWLMFVLAGNHWQNLFQISYSGHFIPLNLLYYWLMIRIFGLNYIPYQLVVSTLHAINVLIIYLIVFKETKRKWLAILTMAVFGFSNVGVENLVWSLGMNYVSAVLFAGLGLLLFLKFEERNKWNLLFLSAFCFLISPLFHNITILLPTGMFLFFLISTKTFSKKWVFMYLIAQIVLFLTSLIISGSQIIKEANFTIFKIFQMGTFITIGVIRGTLLRFILPDVHFERGGDSFSKIFIILFTISASLFVCGLSLKVALNNWHRPANIQKIFRYLIMIVLIYAAAAPTRSGINFGQAGISRYAYPAFFFGLIFVSLILNEIVKNSRTKLIVIAGAIFFLSLNLNANINFNRNFWSKLVSRDRKFVSEVRRIFQNNSTIVDINPKGIWPTMKLSQMWFLFPAGKKLNFVDPTTISMGEQYHDLLTEFQMKGD